MIYNSDEIVYQLADVETGEVNYELREGDSIRVDRREQKEYRANHRNIKDKVGFVKVFLDSLGILLQEDNFTSAEYKIILTAMYFIDYTSGILVEDKCIITKKRFVELIGVSENTFDKGINKLIDKKIIGRAKVGRCNCYLVNPFIFMRGKIINNTLYKLFKSSKWNTQRD